MNAHTFFRRLMIVVLAMVFATIVITDYGNRVAQVGEFGGEASVGSWVAQYCCVDFCYIEGSFEEGCNRLDAPDCEAFIDGPPAADTTCRHTYCNNWYYYTDPTTNLAACNSFCNQFGSGGDSCDVGMTGGIGTIAGGSSAASSTPGGSSTASSGASSAGSSGSGGSSNGSSGSGGSSNGSSGSGGSSQASSGDSSSASSVPITCGNNILQSGEVCDGTQGLYNCPSRACTGSCTCRPLSSSSRASSGGSSSADSQAPISSTASSAGSSQSLIPDPECPQGRAEVTVRSNLQNGINYIHALPSGRYKVEVISPQGIPDMDYVNNSWVNTASDTGLFHGSSVFIVRGADPIFGSDTDPVTRGEGGTRVTNAIVYLDSAKFGPPYNQNRRRAADAARGVSVLLNIQTSERLVFVVNDLVGGTKKSTYVDNRGTVRIRLCAQTLFATSSSASVASSLASSASSSRASSVVSSSVVSVASAFSSARSSAASALSSAASVVSALSSSAFSASVGSSVSATSSVQALVALATDCGNGAVEDGEFCDDGNTSNMDGCTNACRLSSCGDGIIQAPESCDEGVYNSDEFADTCRTGCVLPYCGDDIIDSDESCDDGNTWNDDGCSSDCRRNPPAPCSHNRECSSNLCFSGICMALNVCGNGLREDREWCDDGNQDPYDACMSSCRWSDNMQCEDDDQCDSGYCLNGICAERPVCGDGVVQSGEGCDQGMANSNVIPNRCRLSCMLASLGDGVIDNGEECDDGNAIDGDGCDGRGRSELVAGLIDTQAPVAPSWGATSSAVAYVLPTATLSPPLPVLATLVSAPAGAMANPNTGPAAVVLMASGAAAGFAWIRRKRS